MVLKTTLAIACGVLLMSSPVSGQPATGSIRGRLVLDGSASAAPRRPSIVEPPPASATERIGRPGVVYLEVAPHSAFDDPLPARARMDQRNEMFVPQVLAVRAGTTVDFPNSDRIYHNVFSLSPARRFDLGRYAVGRSKAVRFDRPGVVRVFCDIHSHMHAFILVFAHRYFAVTDARGDFVLAPVPPGTYSLAAWHEGRVRATREVIVRAGEISTVELSVR